MYKIKLFFLFILFSFCLQGADVGLFSPAYAGTTFQVPDLSSLINQKTNIESPEQNELAAEPYTFAQEWSQVTLEGKEHTLLTIWLEPSSGYYTYGHIKKEDVFPTELSYTPVETSDHNALATPLTSEETPDHNTLATGLNPNPPTPSSLPNLMNEPDLTPLPDLPDLLDVLILYPEGRVIVPPHLENSGQDLESLASEIYEGRNPIFILFPAGYKVNGEVKISLLACSIQHCIPLQTNIFVQEPEYLPTSEEMSWYGDFEELLKASAPPSLLVMPTDASLNLPSTQESRESRFSPQSLTGSGVLSGLGVAIILGFFAGLILNIMPCVLPVIAIKIAALLGNVGEDGEQGKKYFVRYNIFFALGIILWFVLLALLLGVAGLTWGQLFQSKIIVLGLTIFLFLLSLSLFHVFHLPILDLQFKNKRTSSNTSVEALSTGFVATLLATPCSGPLLGVVLAYSLTQPLMVQILIFIAMGFGMASPYIIFALRPSLVHFVPKPGNWLLVLEKFLAFFLLGSSIYFLSILPDEWTIRVIILLFVISVCAYVWGTWGSLRMAGLKKALFAGMLLSIIAFFSVFLFVDKEEKDFWVPYTQSTFEELLGKELLVVEFTADWCPTCKILEYTVLTQETLQELENTYGSIFMKVDMTEYDEEQQAFLRSLNSVSIPLLVVFPKGDASRNPIVLRDIYTKSQLYDAVKKADGL